MFGNYDITVTVCTYNPQWNKLKATLLSIIKQKNVKLQIVVSDDGSADSLQTEIKRLFEQDCFTDYKLLASKTNEGTVCNFYHSVCEAEAEFIKLISPGDLLYNETVLSNWLLFTKNNNADLTFGDAVFYNFKNEKLNIVRHTSNPRNLKIYKSTSSYCDKVINYLCLRDSVSGAAKIAKKDILFHYLGFLLNRVIYVEDFFIRLALLDGRNIQYFPSKVIWYEFGDGGISTTGDSKWEELIRKDNIAMDQICLEEWDKQDDEIRDWIIENMEFKKIAHPTFGQRLWRYLKHPSWLYWKLFVELYGEFSPTNVDDTFFNRCYDIN